MLTSPLSLIAFCYLRLHQVFCFPFWFSPTYPLQLCPTSWLFLWHFVTVFCSSSPFVAFLLARAWSTRLSHHPLLHFLSIWVKNISTSLSWVFNKCNSSEFSIGIFKLYCNLHIFSVTILLIFLNILLIFLKVIQKYYPSKDNGF